jgi:streptomycin 6-kinase
LTKQADRLKKQKQIIPDDPFVCCSTLSKWIFAWQTVSVTPPEWWNPGGAKEENE